jgi:predicted peptidase
MRSSNYEQNIDGFKFQNLQKMFFNLLELIKNIEKEYPNIDKNRIYSRFILWGLNCTKLTEYFAKQIAVSCSHSLIFSNLKKLSKKNIWLIHGKR